MKETSPMGTVWGLKARVASENYHQHEIQYTALEELIAKGCWEQSRALHDRLHPNENFDLNRNRFYDLKVYASLGMTETSPIGTVGGLKASVAALPEDAKLKMIEKAGRPHVLVDMRAVLVSLPP